MEYVDGRTVRDVLDSVGAFAIEDAVPLLAAVAGALVARVAEPHTGGGEPRDRRAARVEQAGQPEIAEHGAAGAVLDVDVARPHVAMHDAALAHRRQRRRGDGRRARALPAQAAPPAPARPRRRAQAERERNGRRRVA
jgi:hypothetical protein